MATFDNTQWQHRQDDAAASEYQRARNDIAAIESILGLPASSVPDNKVFSRLDNLKAQAAQQIDPDDNGAQTEPIYWSQTKFGGAQ